MAESEYFLFPLAYAVAHAAYATREGHPEKQIALAFPKTVNPKGPGDYHSVSFLSDIKLLRVHPKFVVFAFDTDSVIVGFTGTNDGRSLWDDSSASTVDRFLARNAEGGAERRLTVGFHAGFYSRAEELFPEVERAILPFLLRRGRVIFTGHSLGGATAAIVTLKTYLKYPDAGIWPCEAGKPSPDSTDGLPPGECFCIGFGSPVPGDARLATAVEQLGLRRAFYTFVNTHDLVPRAYNVLGNGFFRFLESVTGYLTTSTAVETDELISTVRWNPANTTSTSPAFGTYVFMREPGKDTFASQIRDRDAILRTLASNTGSMTEHGRDYYGYRIGEIRMRAITALLKAPLMAKVPLPVSQKEVIAVSLCRGSSSQSGDLVFFYAYDLKRRCVIVVNCSSEEHALCSVAAKDEVIKTLAPHAVTTSAGLVNVHFCMRLPPRTQISITTITLAGAQDFIGAFSSEIIDDAIDGVHRTIMPCVVRLQTVTRLTSKAYMYASMRSLPDNGLRLLVLRHTFSKPMKLVLTFPKAKLDKLSFLLVNCTACKEASSEEAKMRIVATIDGSGYAFLAEYSTEDVATSEWDLETVRPVAPQPSSQSSSPPASPLAPWKPSLSDRAYLFKLEAKWKIKTLFRGY